MGQAKITDKHEDTKQATIILPEPQVLQPRVDHSRTRAPGGGTRGLAAVDRGSRCPSRCRVRRRPRSLSPIRPPVAENIQAAKMTAETVLKALYSEVGWNVVVKWANEPKPSGK